MGTTDKINYKSTVAKGDALENASAELLRKLLSSGDFFLPEKLSKLYQKKKYYSETRKANIIFDIAIETTMPGANTYSLLTLIECKNYDRSIEVEKIEAFESKVRSIGEHNTKAIFISNRALQSSAYQTALSKKIGIIRLFSNNQYEWINFRKKRDFCVDLESAKHMFIDENYKSSNFVGILNNKVFDNIPDLLIEGKIMDYYVHKERFVNIPFVTEEKFAIIVSRLDSHDIRNGAALDTQKLCKFLETVYPVTFDFSVCMPPGLLGKITFDPQKILISLALREDDHKFRFTLAHEIAHLILHAKLLEGISEKSDNEDTLLMSQYSGSEQGRRMEFQANKLASTLLLPTNALVQVVARYFKQNNINKGYLYFDNQSVNRQLVNGLIYNIVEAFNVSPTVAKIRLVELKLIRDNSNIGLRTIIRNVRK
jgi:Zn-dependent peptidase ImmA (M78 family)